MNDVAADGLPDYEPDRYDGWTLTEIIAGLRGASLNLLKRASLASLVARREWGGMLVAASKLVTTVVEQTQLFRRILDLAYNAARMHMKLWMFWPRVAKMLQHREESCRRRSVPFVVPGYKSCLAMAGISGRMGPPIPLDPSPPPVTREPLTDIEALTERVEMLELQNRLEREKSTRLIVELDETKEELHELQTDGTTSREGGWFPKLTGWIGAKLPRIAPPVLAPAKPDRQSKIEIRIGNCLELIEPEENVYDAIVTDAPYSIALHGYDWDSTDISFSSELWSRLFRVLKPGGCIAFFAASRLYHRVGIACETAGFTLYPFLGWRFRDGLPKPINLAELFDRDNLAERDVIGLRRGSGFTQANVDHGAQNRSHVNFVEHARHVSPEAQDWRGYY
jgi:hypothetical protein